MNFLRRRVLLLRKKASAKELSPHPARREAKKKQRLESALRRLREHEAVRACPIKGNIGMAEAGRHSKARCGAPAAARAGSCTWLHCEHKF
jgi:hypothetical protein